jgi:ribose transport system permease protein
MSGGGWSPLRHGVVAPVGAVVGAANAALVVLRRLPATIGTLATGCILATATLFAHRAIGTFAVSPILRFLGAERIASVPVMMPIALAAVGVCVFVLNRTVFGRTLTAAGRNQRAAQLAGVRARRIVTTAKAGVQASPRWRRGSGFPLARE